jgi:L-serine dehydratase
MSISWSVFDVIGPVMIGPSSSHTAGACRLGYMAQAINGKFKKVDIYLHGSFAEVYEGHCTDVAIVAGVLQMDSFDKRLENSFEIAKEKDIEYNIIPTDLGEGLHPNTVKLVFDDNEARSVTGSSIGGGKAVINFIGKIPVSISLEHSTLLIHFGHGIIKPKEVIDRVNALSKNIVNITTGQYKDYSILTIEVREWFTPEDLAQIEAIEGVNWTKFINHLSNFVNIED